MRFKQITTGFVTVCFLAITAPKAQIMSNGPITRENLFSALESMQSGKSKRKDAAWYAARIKGNKVDFHVTDDDERIIRGTTYLGKKGLDELIAALRDNYRGEERETVLEEPKPNIIPVTYGKRHITFDPSAQTFTGSDTGILAVVAEFRNAHEQGKEISEAKDIRAHVYFEPSEFYKSLDRTVPGFASVEEGIWLNERSSVVSFARGETKTLILAVQMQDLGFGGFDAFEHSTRKTDDGRELFLPRIPILTADKYVVKVEIVGGAKGEIAELHHFTITLRPDFNVCFP